MRLMPVAVLALAGCASRTVAVAPSELARNASGLSREQRAIVYTLDGQRTEVRASERVDVYLRDGDVQRPVTLTIGELVDGCGDAPTASCAAYRIVGQKALLRRPRSVDSDVIAKGVGFAAIGGLIGFCLVECQDESSVSRAVGYTGLAIGGVALLFFGAIALGGRD